MSINQVTTFRLPDGREVAFVDWSDKPLYSSADLLAGFSDQQIDLFQYTTGDGVVKTSNITTARQSTDLDTNMATPGSMASTEEMYVYAIRPEIFETKLAAPQGQAGYDANTGTLAYVNQPQPDQRRLAVLQRFLMVVLEISQKWVVQAGFAYFNSGMGPFGGALQTQPGFVFAAPGALALRTAATQGWPSQDAVRSMAIPAYIGGQEKWRLSLMNPGGVSVPSGALALDAGTADPAIMHTIRMNLDGLYKRPVA